MGQNDQKWFDDVYIATVPAVRRYVLSLFRAFPWLPYDPDDIIQEAYLCLYESRDEIYDISGLKPWLIRAARNKTLDIGREYVKRFKVIDGFADIGDETLNILSAADSDAFDFSYYMELCEQRIGKRNLEILQRYYVDKESIKKIAKEEGVSVPIMHVRFQRWKKYCAQIIRSTIWTDLILIVGVVLHKNRLK